MDNENTHKNHRKRLSNKYREQGEKSFLTHQLFELLLFYSIPRKDTNDTAHLLIDDATSLEALIHRPIEKNLNVCGVGENTATLVNLCGAIAKRAENDASSAYCLDSTFRQSRYLFNYYKGAQKGTVCLTYLGEEKELIETYVLCEGKRRSSDDIIYEAVRRAKDLSAQYAILSHIHISGERMPSVEDIYLTASIERALHLAECTLLEHYIVTDSDVTPIEGLNNKSKRKDIDIK